MSNIFIKDIVGSGDYAVPESGAELGVAQSGIETLLGGVALLAWDDVDAMVMDNEGGSRTLCCRISRARYNGSECISETNVDTVGASIRSVLQADDDIDTVGDVNFEMFWTDYVVI